MRKVSRVLLLMTACHVWGAAQALSYGQWVGDHLLMSEGPFAGRSLLVDGDNRVVATVLPRLEGLPLHTPHLVQQVVHQDGVWYFVLPQGQKVDKVLTRSRVVLRQEGPSGVKTQLHGVFELPPHVKRVKLFPLGDRDCLCVSPLDLRKEETSDPTWFSILRLDGKGRYQLADSLSLPQGQFRQLGDPNSIWLVSTPDRVVAFHRDTGAFWIFSREHGRMMRHGWVVSEAADHLQAPLKELLRDAQATRDGDILVTARPLEQVLAQKGPTEQARLKARLEREPEMDFNAWRVLQARASEVDQDRDPFVVWYRLDPVTGRVRRIPAPEGGTEVLRPEQNPNWRPMPDGSVRMGRQTLESLPAKLKEPLGMKRLGTEGPDRSR